MLLTLCGLPGTGKTTIARLLARRLPAIHLRIDSVEQALLAAGITRSVGTEGYVAAYAIARDNLRLGHTVVADAVNALAASRQGWVQVAREAKVGMLLVQVRCSREDEHRRRVRKRQADLHGHVLPTWAAVQRLDFDPVPGSALVVDTAVLGAEEATDVIAARARQGLPLRATRGA